MAIPHNRSVVSVASREGYPLYFARPLVCFNALHLKNALAAIPSSATAVYLHVTDLVTLIDHTTSTTLIEFVDDFKRSGRGIVEILGLERLRPRSHDESCMRVSPPILSEERAVAFQLMARLSMTGENVPPMDLLRTLDQLSLSSCNEPAGHSVDHPVTEFLTQAGGTLFVKVRGSLAFVRSAFHDSHPAVSDPRGDLNWLSLSEPMADVGQPDSALAFLSLTEPGPQPRVHDRAHEDPCDLSLVWATSL